MSECVGEGCTDSSHNQPAAVLTGTEPVVSPEASAVSSAEEPPAMDEVELAAMKFSKLIPFVKKFASNLSLKGSARVHQAVAEFPLGATKPRLLNAAERQLFQVLLELQQHKSVVVTDIVKKRAVEELAAKNNPPVTSVPTETIGIPSAVAEGGEKENVNAEK